MRNIFRRITNESVSENADYWARLGGIMKENVELGIDNSVYDEVVRYHTNNRGWFESLMRFEPLLFIKKFD